VLPTPGVDRKKLEFKVKLKRYAIAGFTGFILSVLLVWLSDGFGYAGASWLDRMPSNVLINGRTDTKFEKMRELIQEGVHLQLGKFLLNEGLILGVVGAMSGITVLYVFDRHHSKNDPRASKEH
jgi:hypothetical protein